MKLRLRSAEWLLVIYFGYVAAIAPRFPFEHSIVWRPLLVELLVCALFLALAYGESHEHAELFSIMRDWVPVALLLLAYREMDWFSSMPRNFDLELRWVEWDRSLLYPWGLQRAVESLGALWPLYLELCYVLVYAVAPFVVAVLYFQYRRERVNGALFLYLLGTLLSYALFPYFPSDPPRTAFAGSDMPHITHAGAPTESLAGGGLRHPLQRVSERARIVGIFGRLGAVCFSPGTQTIRLGNAGLCGKRRRSHLLWALPLCGRRVGGNGGQPSSGRYDSVLLVAFVVFTAFLDCLEALFTPLGAFRGALHSSVPTSSSLASSAPSPLRQPSRTIRV